MTSGSTTRRAFLLLPLLLAACTRPQPLETYGAIPQFDLIAQSGQPFDSHSLDGRPWIANFVYTTCPGPCPMMSHQMHGIQKATAATPDVKLVSFTVDPAHDTPPVLAEYAKHFKADPARWTFLTGEIATLNKLGLDSFKLNPVDGKLDHSVRFVLVDGRRQIRGFYLSTDDGFPNNLLRDLRRLQKETS
ncbi:MAG TPA: SCO family protein [Candidatus Acidoferrum sp.]|jgi:protein SCO1/2|nr:SCO family protein [Candidatus Acidoferrum sp.]